MLALLHNTVEGFSFYNSKTNRVISRHNCRFGEKGMYYVRLMLLLRIMFKGLCGEIQIPPFTKLTVCSGCSMRGDAKQFELQVSMPGRAETHSTVINAKLTIT